MINRRGARTIVICRAEVLSLEIWPQCGGLCSGDVRANKHACADCNTGLPNTILVVTVEQN